MNKRPTTLLAAAFAATLTGAATITVAPSGGDYATLEAAVAAAAAVVSREAVSAANEGRRRILI